MSKLKINNGQIVLDGVLVGILTKYISNSVSRKELLSMFPESKCQKLIVSLNLKPQFKYIWIQDINVFAKYRGKGIMRNVIQILEKPNTLIACAPGTGVKGGGRMPSDARHKVYKKLGFKLAYEKYHHYAFRYTR